MEDNRITAARGRILELDALIAETDDVLRSLTYGTLRGSLVGAVDAYAEIVRVSVGILAESSALKAKARQPEAVDLSALSSADLLAELARRLET